MRTFTYCGINSEKFGCYCYDSDQQRFGNASEYNVYEEQPNWYDGGYYYGTSLKPKQITINCYYEQISRQTKERMMAWLGRRTGGILSFSNCPWKYYYVKPTKSVTGREYTHKLNGYTSDVYSGTFEISFTAYDPIGYVDINKSLQNLGAVSFFIDSVQKFAVKSYDANFNAKLPVIQDNKIIYNYSNMNISTSSPLFLYNCGTEPVNPVIRIGGSASSAGVTIKNTTNGSQCKVLLPPANAYLQIDCDKGIVTVVDGNTKIDGFEFHDLGYIKLEPRGIVLNDVIVSCVSGSNRAKLADIEYTKELIGKTMVIDARLYRIIDVLNDCVVLSGTAEKTKSYTTNIYIPNRLEISGESIALNKFEIQYTPRVL